MQTEEHVISHDDLNGAFDNGSIFSATEKDLERYLRALGTVNIKSDEVRSKSIIRALTINYLQLRFTIERLNLENGILAKRVWVLTVVAVICGIIQAVGVIWTMLH